MAQLRRVVAAGCPHPITQRGNFHRDVFFDDQDRLTCLDLLAQHSAGAQLQILGFCLMSNHIHLIAVPARLDSMAIAMRDTEQAYSRWLNIRLRRRGRAWRNRYFSCPLDPAHAAYAMRYVECNAVRAGMVESVLGSPWSSARAHRGMEAPPGQIDLSGWQLRYPLDQWAEVLGPGFRHSGDLDRPREATRTGRPFGASGFVAELEAKLERTPHPRKRGRKPKAEAEAPHRRVTPAGKG
ncbi:MAG: transposase [Bryobacterales bacterium]|nr:transposase [Bryobacterales bacterium]